MRCPIAARYSHRIGALVQGFSEPMAPAIDLTSARECSRSGLNGKPGRTDGRCGRRTAMKVGNRLSRVTMNGRLVRNADLGGNSERTARRLGTGSSQRMIFAVVTWVAGRCRIVRCRYSRRCADVLVDVIAYVRATGMRDAGHEERQGQNDHRGAQQRRPYARYRSVSHGGIDRNAVSPAAP